MRGSLRERGPRTWELRVSLGPDPKNPGRYLTKYRTHRGTKGTATTALAEFITDVAGGKVAAPTAKGTFGHLLDRWLANVELSPTTRHEYERLVAKRIRPALGDLPLRKVTALELDGLYRKLEGEGLSSGSVRQVHSIIRKALGQAVKWGWLPMNAAQSASPPKHRSRELAPPEPADVVKLLSHVGATDPAFACLLLVAATTGARRGELCGLRWADVDLEHRVMRIHRSVVQVGRNTSEKDTKTHQERRVSLGPETAATLLAHRGQMEARATLADETLGPDAFVWSTDTHGRTPLEPHKLTSQFRAYCTAAGIKCRLHDLRHFTATQMLASGIDVRTVAGRLGHANASTTLKVYAHFVPSADVAAAKLMGELVSPPAGR